LDARKGDALEIDELRIRKKGSLWLWMVRSRENGQILAAVMGNRTMLERLWHKVPLSYRRKLVYTDSYEVYAAFFPIWQHRVSDKRDGRTSRIEGANTLFRARVSGLVRRSCGVCAKRVLDVWQRFLLVKHEHNRKCQQQQERKEREQTTQITTLSRP
jgi:IS1 family transposase